MVKESEEHVLQLLSCVFSITYSNIHERSISNSHFTRILFMDHNLLLMFLYEEVWGNYDGKKKFF